jgi:hypothetical protein
LRLSTPFPLEVSSHFVLIDLIS